MYGINSEGGSEEPGDNQRLESVKKGTTIGKKDL
jgi:hypothetical protein